jgi:hypothetical protein
MKCRPEDVLLFYASLPDHREDILSRTREIAASGIDTHYLESAAERYGAAAGLIGLLSKAGLDPGAGYPGLYPAAAKEIVKTESMLSLYRDVANLLAKEGVEYIPLKGCDRRIARGPRRLGNAMDDIDILVRAADVERAGHILEGNGYLFLGKLSGAHLNFSTDEPFPRFMEIHWDLVNRDSPVQKRLFLPDMGKIWQRSMILCETSHLSHEDILCYLAAHAVKEYFHKPKWLGDIAFVIGDLLPAMDIPRLRIVMKEWGVSRALGMVAEGLELLMDDLPVNILYDAGARKPGFPGKIIAERIVDYRGMYSLRSLSAVACAESPKQVLAVMRGIVEKCVTG